MNSLIRRKAHWGVLGFCGTVLLISVSSCEKDYFPQPPVPRVPVQTEMLEATFSSSSPNSISHAFWKKADFMNVTAQDLSTQNLYEDGVLNMTGTYNGKSQFNNGKNPNIVLKAAYDNQKLYILAEWTDSDMDVSQTSWLWNGPADPLKTDPTAGWTSQRNSDKISFAFDIDGATGQAGNFTSAGCLVSCHNNTMITQSGKVDIWNWDLAASEPLGFVKDMHVDPGTGLISDAGQAMTTRNNAGTTPRSGPAYEWDGMVQTITRPNGTSATLDPAYFLLNKTAFTGDISAGDLHYGAQCASCHGNNGQGGDGPAFNSPVYNRLSRQEFDNRASSFNHTGYTYYNSLTAAERNNVIARIRGFSGVPGIILSPPSGSNTDISALSNVFITNISDVGNHTQYKVLIIRSLDTGNSDDIQFLAPEGKKYVFGIALMDNDGKNHIGSAKQTLLFKQR
jgi:mono/diheme cytochrome c family protein